MDRVNSKEFLDAISRELENKLQDPQYVQRLPMEFERDRLREITLSLAEALREEYKVDDA
jgi:hypothetical protein